MIKVTVTVNMSKFNLDQKIPKFREKLLDQLGKNTKILLEKNTPIDKGRASKAYKITRVSENQSKVFNNTHYLPFVNVGTGIYGPRHSKITPKHARVLHFTWKGREWFLKSVRGQKPQRFVERSMVDINRSVESAVVIASKTLK